MQRNLENSKIQETIEYFGFGKAESYKGQYLGLNDKWTLATFPPFLSLQKGSALYYG